MLRFCLVDDTFGRNKNIGGRPALSIGKTANRRTVREGRRGKLTDPRLAGLEIRQSSPIPANIHSTTHYLHSFVPVLVGEVGGLRRDRQQTDAHFTAIEFPSRTPRR